MRIFFVFRPICFLISLTFVFIFSSSVYAAEGKTNLLVINNAKSAMGVNIAALSYWSTEWTLIDSFKNSSGWLTQCASWDNKCNGNGMTGWNTKEQDKLQLDEYGWIKSFPKQSERNFEFVSTYMFAGAHGKIPAGYYHVLYQGQGEIEYGKPAIFHPELSSPGHDVVEVTQESLNNIEEGGVLISIKSTGDKQGNNYLRNIRFISPGGICDENPAWYAEDEKVCKTVNKKFTPLYEIADKQIFHPLFLQELKPFRALRFMDFLGTNTTKVTSWTKRPKLTDSFYGGDEGAPFELAVQLSNAANADAWLNISPYADDNYIDQAAKYAHQNLKSNLLIYLELGNEAWNFAYPFNKAGEYFENKAKAEWGNTDGTGRLSFYAKRAGEMCDIWRKEFGKDSKQVKCVISGMAGWSDITKRVLECPYYQSQTHQACGKKFDVLAIAPYFGGYIARDSYLKLLERWNERDKDVKTKLFWELTGIGSDGKPADAPMFQATEKGEKWPSPQHGAMQAIEKMITEHKQIADAYGLQLAAYEGGSDLTQFPPPQEDSAITKLLSDMVRDPRMGAVYEKYYDAWRNGGGTLFMHFSSVGRYSKWGAYPLKEFQGQKKSVKYDATIDYSMEHPCWWGGCERTGFK